MDLHGHIVTPAGIVPGVVAFGERITDIRPATGVPDRFVLPGFIDAHVHGGDGGDTMDGVAGIATLARFHLRHGSTTLLPTTITRPWAEVMQALHAVVAARQTPAPGAARLHGAHLEGPFLNPTRLGAQPPFAILPTPDLVREVLALDIVRVVTLAPERDGAMAAVAQFAQAGVHVSLGHSAADFDTGATALAAAAAAGCVGAGTHLFNAMGGIEGRNPGLTGALLDSDSTYVEVILDFHHVHPASFRLALARAGDRLVLITDAMRAAGMENGESELGGQKVIIRNGEARLETGSLAGSVLTMDVALRNVLRAGVPLEQAARLVSTNAAHYLGLTDRGRIATGMLADLVVLDADFTVREVWLGGVRQT